MKWSSLVGAFLFGICSILPNGVAEDDVLPVIDDLEGQPIDGSPYITNKTKCMTANGGGYTVRCPSESVVEQLGPCPTGSCYSWGIGCVYGGNPPSIHGRQSESEHLNSGEVWQPNESSPGSGFKVEKDGEPIVCYRTRSCICDVQGTGSGTCKTGEWREVGLQKWKITDQPCLPIAAEEPELDPVIYPQ